LEDILFGVPMSLPLELFYFK